MNNYVPIQVKNMKTYKYQDLKHIEKLCCDHFLNELHLPNRSVKDVFSWILGFNSHAHLKDNISKTPISVLEILEQYSPILNPKDFSKRCNVLRSNLDKNANESIRSLQVDELVQTVYHFQDFPLIANELENFKCHCCKSIPNREVPVSTYECTGNIHNALNSTEYLFLDSYNTKLVEKSRMPESGFQKVEIDFRICKPCFVKLKSENPELAQLLELPLAEQKLAIRFKPSQSMFRYLETDSYKQKIEAKSLYFNISSAYSSADYFNYLSPWNV